MECAGNKGFRELMMEGVIEMTNDSLGTIRCKICNKTMVGETPLKQHLQGGSHKEAAAKTAIACPKSAPSCCFDELLPLTKEAVKREVIRVNQMGNTMCSICSVELTGRQQIEDHLNGNDHTKKSYGVMLNVQIPLPAAPTPPNPMKLSEDEDITRAKEMGIISLTDNKLEPFHCNICNKNFNGMRSLLDHFQSKRHKKKESENPSTLDTRFANLKVWSQLPTSFEYTVNSSPRGEVFVFNYVFRNRRGYREGAEQDSRNLEKTFSVLGYNVNILEDLTTEDTLNEFQMIVKNQRLQYEDSLIIFILSHGSDAYTFQTSDGKTMNLFNLRKMFTDGKCPYMKNKPKIFFTNYCRGNNLEKMETDSDEIEIPNDMATIHAAAEGIKVLRNPKIGTYFVATLCEVLTRHAGTHDLRDIYSLLHDTLMRDCKTRPMWEDYGFKKFRFNPVNHLMGK